MTPLVRELLATVIGLCHSNAAMTSLSAHFRGQATCKVCGRQAIDSFAEGA